MPGSRFRKTSSHLMSLNATCVSGTERAQCTAGHTHVNVEARIPCDTVQRHPLARVFYEYLGEASRDVDRTNTGQTYSAR